MAIPLVVWHGTQTESDELLAAIGGNCQCEFGMMGMRVSTCAPHKGLLEDQRWLDGLLWERRLRNCRLREEWSTV